MVIPYWFRCASKSSLLDDLFFMARLRFSVLLDCRRGFLFFFASASSSISVALARVNSVPLYGFTRPLFKFCDSMATRVLLAANGGDIVRSQQEISRLHRTFSLLRR